MRGERAQAEIEAVAHELIASGARGHGSGRFRRNGPGDGLPREVGVRLRPRPSRRRRAAPWPGVRDGGVNGSAAYAEIDSGVAVAVMRNRFAAGDLTTAARIDRIVARALT